MRIERSMPSAPLLGAAATARRRQWVAAAPGVSALAFLLLNAARRLVRLSALLEEKAGERE
jgi:hypothetical protein